MESFVNNRNCLNCEHCFVKNPLFKLLTNQELEILNNSRVEVAYKKGEMIYKQGMPLTHLVILRSGIGKIYIEGNKGRNLILSYAKAFDINAGIGVFLDHIHHSSLMAADDCTTCFIEVKAFKEVMRGNPDFTEAYLAYCSNRVLKTYHQFTVLTQKNMEGRMAEAILYLLDNLFANGVIENVSKVDLAEFTAMSKESAIRVLKGFQDIGYLEIEEKKMKILSEAALRKVALHG